MVACLVQILNFYRIEAISWLTELLIFVCIIAMLQLHGSFLLQDSTSCKVSINMLDCLVVFFICAIKHLCSIYSYIFNDPTFIIHLDRLSFLSSSHSEIIRNYEICRQQVGFLRRDEPILLFKIFVIEGNTLEGRCAVMVEFLRIYGLS
jgi:hypothetical protein